MDINVDFVLRCNSQGQYNYNYINLLSLINNARHFNTECRDVEYCFWLGFVKQGPEYSENYHFLVFG